MNPFDPQTILVIAAIGLALIFIGPKLWRWGASKLTPEHKCLPATDAERIEMLMQMRDLDGRFASAKAKLALNHTIECLTGTVDPEPTPEPVV